MKTMTAMEVRKNWSEMLAASKREPVHIIKNGKEKAVIISVEKYQELFGHLDRLPSEFLMDG